MNHNEFESCNLGENHKYIYLFVLFEIWGTHLGVNPARCNVKTSEHTCFDKEIQLYTDAKLFNAGNTIQFIREYHCFEYIKMTFQHIKRIHSFKFYRNRRGKKLTTNIPKKQTNVTWHQWKKKNSRFWRLFTLFKLL